MRGAVHLSFDASRSSRSGRGPKLHFRTSLEDRVSGGAGCSLQEAIYSATYKDSVTITSYKPDGTPIDGFTGCVKGSKTEEDVIVLPSGAQPAVFQLNRIIEDVDNSVGPTATPPIRSSITIEANGAELLWIGADHARAFVVEATGHLTIRNAYIKGFTARGGNGSRGGAEDSVPAAPSSLREVVW